MRGWGEGEGDHESRPYGGRGETTSQSPTARILQGPKGEREDVRYCAGMKMASGLKRARFGERLNRFLARVEVDGKETMVHVPNSGRMRELFVPGATVYVSPAVTYGRKTAFDLRLVSIDGILVSCDSRLPPSLVAEAQSLGRLWEFAGYPVIERERIFGESRLDLCFSGPKGRVYVETKSATLVRDGRACSRTHPRAVGQSTFES